MSEPSGVDELPDAYHPKKIIGVEPEEPGWLLEFECGHVVWCAVPAKVGETMYCGVCLNNFADELLEKQP